MPASPYLNEPPDGLWTWPRLIRWIAPTFLAISAVAAWQNLLLQWFGLSTAILVASIIMRR